MAVPESRTAAAGHKYESLSSDLLFPCSSFLTKAVLRLQAWFVPLRELGVFPHKEPPNMIGGTAAGPGGFGSVDCSLPALPHHTTR